MSDNPEVVELPVWLGGCEKWVTGLTKRTTCDDVLYALLHHEGNPNDCVDVSSFAIFERWREVERPLRGRTKILKVWRAWGEEGSTVRFSVRKLETPLDTSSEVAKTKRTRKNLSGRDRDRRSRDKVRSRSNTGTNPQQTSSSYSKQNGCLEDKDDRYKARAFHELVQLVIEQEKTIQEQLTRVRDTDRHIENYETKMHELRMRENGQNYVQEAYLREKSDESSGGEELFPAIKANDLEAYMHICENILQLEERITGEQDRVLDLSVQIQEESILEFPPTPPRPSYHQPPPPVARGDGARSGPLASVPEDQLQEEIERLRQEVQRSQSLSEAQQHQLQLVSKTLQECELQLNQKGDYINRMLFEVNNVESLGVAPSQSDSVFYSSKERHSSSTSGVSEVSELEGSDRSTSRTRSDSRSRDRVREPSNDRARERSRDRSVPMPSTRGLPGGSKPPLPQTHRTYNKPPTIAQHPNEEEYYVTRTFYPSSQSYPDAYLSAHKHISDDSNSDTGLSSLHSDEAPPILETLV